MRPIFLSLAAVLLLALGIRIAASRLGSTPEEERAEQASTLEGRVPGKSTRSEQTLLSSVDAAKLLRALPDKHLADAPRFEEVEALARRLSDTELLQLIDEVGVDDPGGLTGWLRSALWAELGRRDPDGGLNALLDRVNANDGNAAAYALDQIAFAYFRGRIGATAFNDETVRALLNDMGRLQAIGRVPTGVGRAVGIFFEEYARQDPAAAWKAVEEGRFDLLSTNPNHAGLPEGTTVPGFLPEGTETTSAVGFFRGLGNAEDARQYLELWSPQRETPNAKEAYENYQKLLMSSFSGIVLIPPEETIAAAAAASLARFDLQGAMSWLHKDEPANAMADWNRTYNVLQNLARDSPEAARHWLGDSSLSEYHARLAQFLIQDSPTSAPEIIGLLTAPKVQQEALELHHPLLTSVHVDDFFPAPGGSNRLPDFQQRYEALSEAIDLLSASEEVKTAHRAALEEAFAERLSSAE